MSSEPSVHCERVVAMGSGQSLVGSRVQQTHNCTEQHPRYGVSPRVYRAAGRQCSRWLCGHPSTVACVPATTDRSCSHLPDRLASTRSLILSHVEDHEIMGVVLPSFCLPAQLGPLPTSPCETHFASVNISPAPDLQTGHSEYRKR